MAHSVKEPPTPEQEAQGGAPTELAAPIVCAIEPLASLEVAAVYAEHKQFVWSMLHRLGAREADLEDVFQEVFVVVHRRLPEFRPGAPMQPWLFGICVRLLANHRRRAHRSRELASSDSLDWYATAADTSEEIVAQEQARRVLEAILDSISEKKRVVFVMFEIEGLSCEEIAAALGVPVGTVYSRLHSARKAFARRLERHRRAGGAP
jgi:RNA polymerase sigma-70 factor, ECF subfamily